MLDVYKNIEKNNPDRKRKVLTVLDDMIADIMHRLVVRARS